MGKDRGQGWDEERRGEPGASSAWASGSQRIWSISSTFRWLLDVVLAVVIVGLVLDRSYHKERYGQFEGTGDLTGFAPKSESR